MDVIEILTRLVQEKEFKEWKAENPASYLAHVFKMMDDLNKDDWQIGFYNKDDTMTSFVVTPKSVKKTKSENIFKHPGKSVEELDEKKVEISMTKALATAEKVQATEYTGEIPFKIICILQNIEGAQVYNITYVTQSFKTLNMRIDAASGKVLSKKLSNLMDYKAK